jgi:hypothetical protein
MSVIVKTHVNATKMEKGKKLQGRGGELAF